MEELAVYSLLLAGPQSFAFHSHCSLSTGRGVLKLFLLNILSFYTRFTKELLNLLKKICGSKCAYLLCFVNVF